MFKALQDSKIIAMSEQREVVILTDEGEETVLLSPEEHFPLLNYDEITEDTEHTCEDYVHVDGEFVLKTDDKAIRKEKDQRIAELKQYLAETDYIANKLIEAVDETELQDLKEKYADTLKKRREARAEINQMEK